MTGCKRRDRLGLGFAVVALTVACAHEPRPPPTGTVRAKLRDCSVPGPLAPRYRTAEGFPPPGVDQVAAEFVVDAQGAVRDVRVQAPGAYSDVLRRHLESCRYSPTFKDGQPVPDRVTITVGRRPEG